MPEKRQSFRKKLRKPRLSVLGKQIKNFYILAFSQKHVRFFLCDANSLHEVELNSKAPQNLKESNRFLELHKVYQGHAVPSSSKPGYITHGHGGGKEDEKLRIKEYIHELSKYVSQALKGKHELLILAAVQYEIDMFRNQSDYPYITSQAIKGNPDSWTPKELHKRAMPIMREILQKEHLALHLDADQTTKNDHSRR